MLTNTRASRHPLILRALLYVLIPLSACDAVGPSQKNADAKLQEAADFFGYVTDRVRRDYVEPVPVDKMLDGALNGMLGALDPHSAYLDPKKFDEMKKQTKGKFGGLGMEVTMEEGVLKVITPIEDTPAFKGGIQAGDAIIMVNEEPLFGLSIIEAVDKLRGEPNTEVKVTIRRGDGTTMDLTLKRAIINVKPIKWRIEENIGYIRITTFNENTTQDLLSAIQEIRQKLGDKLTGFVVDLRNNAGGLLEEAVGVTDAFLPKGEIVSIRGRDPQQEQKFEASANDRTKGAPLVILINGGSASASEIVAGALQDHHRALIVGTKSFGKGSVQTVLPLNNGGAVKLTTALYYTPSGRSIQKTGINPDIVVEQQVDLKAIDEEARIREASFRDALEVKKDQKKNEDEKNPAKSGVGKPQPDAKPEGQSEPKNSDPKIKIAPAGPLKEVPDYQLLQAFNILKAISFKQSLQPLATKQKK
ncbi:MAG: S41 family peptidase [Holosporales bacterium]